VYELAKIKGATVGKREDRNRINLGYVEVDGHFFQVR